MSLIRRINIQDPVTGDLASVNSDGQLHVVLMGTVDTGNSTSSILQVGGVFQGVAKDTLDYGYVYVNVYSDVASATDGLEVQFSSDGVNWDGSDNYTVPAGTGKTYAFQPGYKWIRVKYTNGGTIQSEFRLQTIMKKTASKPSSHRVQDSIVDEDDSELVKAVLTAKNPSDVFINVAATASGNLRTTNAEDGLAIAAGDVTNTSFVHKFGLAPDFDTTDNFVTIWDGADDSTVNQMVYQYSATAIIDSLSSSSGSDTGDIEVQGLDSNYDVVTQTITLTGQTRKALTTNLIRVFRMKNVGSSDFVGNVFCYENTALSSGTPIDTTKIRAMVKNGNNQTLMAVYTVPNGKVAYMRDWYAATAGANKSSNYIVKLRARPFGQVFQLKHISSVGDSGTSKSQHFYSEPEVFSAKTDIEMSVAMQAAGGTTAAVAAGFDIVLKDV